MMNPNDRAKIAVYRHVAELRQMATDGVITDIDHDTVGRILRDHIHQLIGVSTFAWDKFKTIVDESRAIHYGDRVKLR